MDSMPSVAGLITIATSVVVGGMEAPTAASGVTTTAGEGAAAVLLAAVRGKSYENILGCITYSFNARYGGEDVVG